MTETMDCGQARLCLGVFVLGAIDPAERALVDAHLATCRDCRDELAGLAGLPALLARVSTEEAAALAEDGAEREAVGAADASAVNDRAANALAAKDRAAKDRAAEDRAAEDRAAEDRAEDGSPGGRQPPRELLGTVLDLTAARRRRRNWRNAGLSAAAAVIIAAAAFGGARLAASQGTNPGAPAHAVQDFDYGNPVTGWETAHAETSGMYVAVTFRGMSWGTQIAARVVGVPVGTPCQLIVVGPDGSKTVAGAWVTDTAEGTVYYPGSAGVPARAIQEFQLTVAGHPTIVVPA
jgi:predicted anti-sigma-YlaC factor YlaD